LGFQSSHQFFAKWKKFQKQLRFLDAPATTRRVATKSADAFIP